MIEFSTAGQCGSINPCNVGVWATFTLAFAVAFSVLLCNLLCPPLMHFLISDKHHRLHIRRWMRAARHMVHVYHHHHVVVKANEQPQPKPADTESESKNKEVQLTSNATGSAENSI